MPVPEPKAPVGTEGGRMPGAKDMMPGFVDQDGFFLCIHPPEKEYQAAFFGT
jgi:hypothetical protein